MTVPFGSTVKARSVVASLAMALLLASGCKQDEGEPSSAPPNPVPRANLTRPVQPPRTDQGGEMKGATEVEKDLHKDLAAPVIKPDVPTTKTPPAAKPDAAKTVRPERSARIDRPLVARAGGACHDGVRPSVKPTSSARRGPRPRPRRRSRPGRGRRTAGTAYRGSGR